MTVFPPSKSVKLDDGSASSPVKMFVAWSLHERELSERTVGDMAPVATAPVEKNRGCSALPADRKHAPGLS